MEILCIVGIVLLMAWAIDSSNKRRYAATQRLARLEGKMDLILNRAGIQLPSPSASPVVMSWIEAGMKIQAIKAYREETGASLADAKQAVEDLARTLQVGAIPSAIEFPGEEEYSPDRTQVKRGLG